MSETEIIPVPFEFIADDEGATAYHPMFDRIIVRDWGEVVKVTLSSGDEEISHLLTPNVAKSVAAKLADTADVVASRLASES